MQAHAMDFDVMGGGSSTGRLLVRFTLEPVLDKVASAERGHPVFIDVEHIEKMVPGDKTTRVHRPVREQDKREHAGAYAAFRSGQEAPLNGLPLREWPGCTRGEAEMLGHFKIRTVEELASVNDGNAQQVGPILALRQRARDYLAQAANAAPMEKMRSELQARDMEIASLRQRVEELGAALAKKRS